MWLVFNRFYTLGILRRQILCHLQVLTLLLETLMYCLKYVRAGRPVNVRVTKKCKHYTG